ncbi:hypothetical protein EW026_g3325 [Hermanssonia centrifuga]|uniref:Hydroxyneurosporene synthase n=1 Tax=Hermanssonia centrifuga TaxID=98765 RepID=A0A4S4KLI5_9APHY|nr:hypothetical protein EW026_g3325 [Hermanssonia centrifuga]
MRAHSLLLLPVTVLTVCAIAATALAFPPVSVDVIRGQTSQGPSTVQFLSEKDGFDGPKVKSLNSTTSDWWYFDVVSSNLDASVVIAFFSAESTGLWEGIPDLGTATWAYTIITFPNGTQSVIFFPVDQMTVVTVENGGYATMGNQTGWAGTPDMSEYWVWVDAPDAGIEGNLVLKSVATGHSPCAPASSPPGQSFELGPDFGWNNAVPDADARVDLTINGSRLKFSGSGYHDKNWGSRPIETVVGSWYWGHARVGPLSIVWFDFIAPDGTEKPSSYVSSDGTLISSTCDLAGSVRPTGVNATFPPTSQSAPASGFRVIIPSQDGEGLTFNITHKEVIYDSPGQAVRWIGSVSGGFNNGTVWDSGIALYEQFTFVD